MNVWNVAKHYKLTIVMIKEKIVHIHMFHVFIFNKKKQKTKNNCVLQMAAHNLSGRRFLAALKTF